MLLSAASSEWDLASEFSAVQSISAGTILFRKGDPSQSALLVVSGWVGSVRLEQDGRERCVALYPQGSLLGLVELFAEQKYSETAVTLSLSRLRWITASAFRDRIETDPRFAKQVTRALGRQDYARGICLTQSGCVSLRERAEQLFWLLLRAQSRNGATLNGSRVECRLPSPVMRLHLAQMLGVSAECFSRLLGKMEKEGVLERREGWLIFFDPENLWRASEIEDMAKSNWGQNGELPLADPIYA
jgi:CRP-like cAMP-binding protein